MPFSNICGIIILEQKRGSAMTIVLIILAAAAIIYLYAAVAFYYGFKNWMPLCGCTGKTCVPRKTVSH
jgi:CHASE2 domain-containing sensor protein